MCQDMSAWHPDLSDLSAFANDFRSGLDVRTRTSISAAGVRGLHGRGEESRIRVVDGNAFDVSGRLISNELP
jgi:hypothetical protein